MTPNEREVMARFNKSKNGRLAASRVVDSLAIQSKYDANNTAQNNHGLTNGPKWETPKELPMSTDEIERRVKNGTYVRRSNSYDSIINLQSFSDKQRKSLGMSDARTGDEIERRVINGTWVESPKITGPATQPNTITQKILEAQANAAPTQAKKPLTKEELIGNCFWRKNHACAGGLVQITSVCAFTAAVQLM